MLGRDCQKVYFSFPLCMGVKWVFSDILTEQAVEKDFLKLGCGIRRAVRVREGKSE